MGKDQMIDRCTVSIAQANKANEHLQRVIDTLEGERELDIVAEATSAVEAMDKAAEHAQELLEELEGT